VTAGVPNEALPLDDGSRRGTIGPVRDTEPGRERDHHGLAVLTEVERLTQG